MKTIDKNWIELFVLDSNNWNQFNCIETLAIF